MVHSVQQNRTYCHVTMTNPKKFIFMITTQYSMHQKMFATTIHRNSLHCLFRGKLQVKSETQQGFSSAHAHLRRSESLERSFLCNCCLRSNLRSVLKTSCCWTQTSPILHQNRTQVLADGISDHSNHSDHSKYCDGCL